MSLAACAARREADSNSGAAAGSIGAPAQAGTGSAPLRAREAGAAVREGGGSGSREDGSPPMPQRPGAQGMPAAGLQQAPQAGVTLDGECVSTGTIRAALRPANLLFLIDRSGSMNCNLPPITDSASCEADPTRVDPAAPSKWEVVRAALEDAVAQLPSSASAAVTYFSNDDRCGVQSAPHVPMDRLDGPHRATLTDSLGAVELRGGTPLVGGLILAYKQLNPDQTPNQPIGKRFVVLLTDGQEGCAPAEVERLLGEELPKSRTARITTFVVGVPGSEVARRFLSRLAFAGGAPRSDDCEHGADDPSVGDCHFDMTRDEDLASTLRQALSRITDTALGCEFDVPEPPNGVPLDYAKINVVFTEAAGGTEQLLPQDTHAPCEEGADGWQYNDDKTQVRLCGQACDRVRRAASIRIALGCESVHVD